MENFRAFSERVGGEYILDGGLGELRLLWLGFDNEASCDYWTSDGWYLTGLYFYLRHKNKLS